MIDSADRQALDQLKAQVQCSKHFACVDKAVSDLCEGVYHRDLDILECLNKSEPRCQFCRPFSATHVCTCPLRKLIAQNFDRWSANETAILRQARPTPAVFNGGADAPA